MSITKVKLKLFLFIFVQKNHFVKLYYLQYLWVGYADKLSVSSFLEALEDSVSSSTGGDEKDSQSQHNDPMDESKD